MADGDTVTLAMACVGLFTHNCRTATSPEPNPRVVSPFTNCMLKVVTSTMAEIPCGNEGMKAGDSVEVETTAAGGSLCGEEEGKGGCVCGCRKGEVLPDRERTRP